MLMTMTMMKWAMETTLMTFRLPCRNDLITKIPPSKSLPVENTNIDIANNTNNNNSRNNRENNSGLLARI